MGKRIRRTKKEITVDKAVSDLNIQNVFKSEISKCWKKYNEVIDGVYHLGNGGQIWLTSVEMEDTTDIIADVEYGVAYHNETFIANNGAVVNNQQNSDEGSAGNTPWHNPWDEVKYWVDNCKIEAYYREVVEADDLKSEYSAFVDLHWLGKELQQKYFGTTFEETPVLIGNYNQTKGNKVTLIKL